MIFYIKGTESKLIRESCQFYQKGCSLKFFESHKQKKKDKTEAKKQSEFLTRLSLVETYPDINQIVKRSQHKFFLQGNQKVNNIKDWLLDVTF